MKKSFLTCLIFFLLTDVFSQQVTQRGTSVVNPERSFKNLYALIIGISDYQNDTDIFKDLEFAHADAILFKDYLTTFYDFKTGTGNISLLLDKEATRTRIINELKQIVALAKEGDLVVVYFAGHGNIEKVGKDDHGYLFAYDKRNDDVDGSSIDMSDLNSYLAVLTEKKAQTVLILDACHSGFAADRSFNGKLAEKAEKVSVHKMLSSNVNEVSHESSNLCKGHGYFTYYLVKGLLGSADGSGQTTPDNLVSLNELRAYLTADPIRKAPPKTQTADIISNDYDFIFGRAFSEVSKALECLLGEQNINTKFVTYSSSDNSKESMRELPKAQLDLYKQFTLAIEQNRLISPLQNNAFYFYEKLRTGGLSQIQLSEVSLKWKVPFQEVAQSLIYKYLDNGKIPTYDQYELGSELLKKCLQYTELTDNSYEELRAKQVFMESYALHRKYSQYKLIISEQQRQELYRKQIEKLENLPNKRELPYIQCVLGRFYLEVNDKEKAKIAYIRASVLAPNWAFPKYNLVTLQNLKTKEKVKQYESFIKQFPNFVRGYHELAELYRSPQIKKTQQSLETLQKALQIAQDIEEDSVEIATIFRNIGHHYKSERKNEKAIEYYLRAIKLSKEIINIYDDLAYLYSQQGEYDKALDFVEKGLKVNPYYNWFGFRKGLIYSAKKDYTASEKAFKEAIEINPYDSDGYYFLAYFYRTRADWSKAGESIKKAIDMAKQKRDSTNICIYLYEAGHSSYDKKEYDEAIFNYNQAIRYNPINGDAHYYLGQAQYYSKDTLRAFSSFSRILTEELGCEFNVYDWLGKIAEERNSKNIALNYFRKSLQQNPENDFALPRVINLLNDRGYKDSVDYYVSRAIYSNEYYSSKQFSKLYDYYLSKVKVEQYRWAYLAIGLMYEKGLGISRNINEAKKWFMYAHQMSFLPGTKKLIELYETGQIAVPSKEKIIDLLKKNQNGKKFTVPCVLPDGSKSPFDFYIIDYPLDEDNPISIEVSRLKETFNATVPDEVATSFNKLYALATKNSVSFGDLTVYALEAANEEKKKVELEAMGNSTKTVSIDYFDRAEKLINEGKIDEGLAEMDKAILDAERLFDMPYATTYKKLLDKIREETNEGRLGRLYYAMGYLHEFSPTDKSNGRAIKWYMYGFQQNHRFCTYRLKRLYKYVSESKVDWFNKNSVKGVLKRYVRVQTANGEAKEIPIYILEYPVSFINPLEQEEQRLQDVYNIEIGLQTKNTYRALFQEANAQQKSFHQICRQYFNAEESKKFISKDQEYLNIGLELYNDKKYEAAIEQFTFSIKVNDKNYRAYALRGIVYAMQKEYRKSIIDLQQSLDLEPDNADISSVLGAVYVQLKEYEKAQLSYEKAYELGQNKNKSVCYNLACLYSLKNQKIKALRFFEEALENGFEDFEHIKKDSDLDNIRDLGRFKDLITRYSKK